jgi:hypothetical protein
MKGGPEVRVKEEVYPSGAIHYSVWYGSDRIGWIIRQGDQFMRLNGRKAFNTLAEAVRELIHKKTQQYMREAAKLSAALTAPITMLSAPAILPAPPRPTGETSK